MIDNPCHGWYKQMWCEASLAEYGNNADASSNIDCAIELAIIFAADLCMAKAT